MKQNSARNTKQQLRTLINLLTEIKLEENEGTHKTFIRVDVAEILTVPICVTIAKLPFGNLTCLKTIDVIVVRNEIEQAM